MCELYLTEVAYYGDDDVDDDDVMFELNFFFYSGCCRVIYRPKSNAALCLFHLRNNIPYASMEGNECGCFHY